MGQKLEDQGEMMKVWTLRSKGDNYSLFSWVLNISRNRASNTWLVTHLPQRTRQWHIVSPVVTGKYFKNMSDAEK